MSTESNMTDALDENVEPAADQPNNDNNQNLADHTQEEVDYLSQFVGEDKPYKTVDEAAKALAKKAAHADQFIETLKKEKQELEERTKEAKTVEDIIAALNKEHESDNKPSHQDQSEEVPKGLTVDQLEEWFENREKKKQEELKVQEQVSKIKENQNKAWELLSSEDYFGSQDSAKRAMRKYIEADESRKEVINNLGGYDPEGLAKLLKAVTPNEQVNFTDDTGIQSTASDFPKGQLTWDKVRAAEKENPKLKKDRKWQRYVTDNLVLN